MTPTLTPLLRRQTLLDHMAGWALATIPSLFTDLLAEHGHALDERVRRQVERVAVRGPQALATQAVRSVGHHLRLLPDSGFERTHPADLDALAARLCFQRWRYLTQRLTEDLRDQPVEPQRQRVRALLVWLRWGEASRRLPHASQGTDRE